MSLPTARCNNVIRLTVIGSTIKITGVMFLPRFVCLLVGLSVIKNYRRIFMKYLEGLLDLGKTNNRL